MELDWVTFGLEVINFLILAWLLQRFLYKPVLAAIARRKATIEKNLADARARQTDAQTLDRRYQDRLAEWEQEKGGLRAKAMEEANAERARSMAALRDTLEQEREKNHVLEQRRLNEMQSRLEEEAIAEGARFAARLLERVASPEFEAKLVALLLEDFASLPEGRLQAMRSAGRDTGFKIKVTSAFPLNEAPRHALIQGLESISKANVSAEFDEDRRLLAGLRIRIGSWVLRANLEDELKFFVEASQHAARKA